MAGGLMQLVAHGCQDNIELTYEYRINQRNQNEKLVRDCKIFIKKKFREFMNMPDELIIEIMIYSGHIKLLYKHKISHIITKEINFTMDKNYEFIGFVFLTVCEAGETKHYILDKNIKTFKVIKFGNLIKGYYGNESL